MQWQRKCNSSVIMSLLISLRAPHSRRRFLRPGFTYVVRAVVATVLLMGGAYAQDRPALNEFTTWFSGQFKNEHCFASDTRNSRMYEWEFRYSRLIYTSRPFAVRWVADIVPMTLVGDPFSHDGHRHYTYGWGGSPVGAQVNWLRSRRVEPFLTAGGGALYFNHNMLQATHFNFTAQLDAGVQLFNSNRSRSFDLGWKYHHISNANLGNVNHGMDSLMVFVGVSFLR